MARHRSGFSLIETMVALTILGLGLLPVLAALAWAHREGRRGADRAAAAIVLAGVMQRLRAEAEAGLGICAGTVQDSLSEGRVRVVWAGSGSGPVRTVVAAASVRGPDSVRDSVEVRLWCG